MCAQYFVIVSYSKVLRDNACMYDAHVCFYVCCCGSAEVCGDVCGISGIVEGCLCSPPWSLKYNTYIIFKRLRIEGSTVAVYDSEKKKKYIVTICFRYVPLKLCCTPSTARDLKCSQNARIERVLKLRLTSNVA